MGVLVVWIECVILGLILQSVHVGRWAHYRDDLIVYEGAVLSLRLPHLLHDLLLQLATGIWIIQKHLFQRIHDPAGVIHERQILHRIFLRVLLLKMGEHKFLMALG